MKFQSIKKTFYFVKFDMYIYFSKCLCIQLKNFIISDFIFIFFLEEN